MRLKKRGFQLSYQRSMRYKEGIEREEDDEDLSQNKAFRRIVEADGIVYIRVEYMVEKQARRERTDKEDARA